MQVIKNSILSYNWQSNQLERPFDMQKSDQEQKVFVPGQAVCGLQVDLGRYFLQIC